MTDEERQMYQAIADAFWWLAVIGTGFVTITIITLFPLIWSDLCAIFRGRNDHKRTR